MYETQWQLFFSVALFLISPVETSEERVLLEAPVSVENASATISDMRS